MSCSSLYADDKDGKEGARVWSVWRSLVLFSPPIESKGKSVNYAGLLQSALVALLRNKMRSVLTVLGITIGIAAVICVGAIGKAGQARVEQQLNNLGDNFVWVEPGGRAGDGVRSGTQATQPWISGGAGATRNHCTLMKSGLP